MMYSWRFHCYCTLNWCYGVGQVDMGTLAVDAGNREATTQLERLVPGTSDRCSMALKDSSFNVGYVTGKPTHTHSHCGPNA